MRNEQRGPGGGGAAERHTKIDWSQNSFFVTEVSVFISDLDVRVEAL